MRTSRTRPLSLVPCPGGNPLVGAVHVERQSDHERVGAPAFDEPVDGLPVRLAPGPESSRAAWRCGSPSARSRSRWRFSPKSNAISVCVSVHPARSYRIRRRGSSRPDAARRGRPPSARGRVRGQGVGNGRATALLFAREGARVLCVDRDPDSAAETVEMIASEGGESANLRGGT